jgi:hypothetical protein
MLVLIELNQFGKLIKGNIEFQSVLTGKKKIEKYSQKR